MWENILKFQNNPNNLYSITNTKEAERLFLATDNNCVLTNDVRGKTNELSSLFIENDIFKKRFVM